MHSRDGTYNVALNPRQRNFKLSVLTTLTSLMWGKLISTATDPYRRRRQWQLLSSKPVSLSTERSTNAFAVNVPVGGASSGTSVTRGTC